MAFDPVSYAVQQAVAQGIDPQLAVNVLFRESSGRSGAISGKDARGYMQLTPAAAQEMGVDRDDPQQNIAGGVGYLAKQIKRFGSNELGVAAFNSGPGAVAKYGGVPPYKETQNYVRSVIPSNSAPSQSTPTTDQLDADVWGDPHKPGAPSPADEKLDEDVWGKQAPAPKSGDGSVVDLYTNKPLTAGQTSTLHQMGDLYNQKAPQGSMNYPFHSDSDADTAAVPNGAYYIPVGGGLVQKGAAPGLAIARQGELHNAEVENGIKIPFLTDFTQSATSPFNDEIAGAVGFGTQGLYNMGAKALGMPINVTAGQRGQAATEMERAVQNARQLNDPWVSGAGRIAGGFTAVPGAGAAPGFLGTVGQIAGTGAVYGAADANPNPSSSLPQQIMDRGKGAAEGAGTALATAGALKVGGATFAPILRPLGNLAAGAVRGLSGGLLFPAPSVASGAAPAVAKGAAGYISSLMNGSGLSAADLAASQAPTAAEALGSGGINATAALARRPGTTGDAADAILLPRAAERGQRLVDQFGQITGIAPDAARGDIDTLVANGRATAKPLYDSLYADPNLYNSPTMQRVFGTPVGRSALTQTHINMSNDPFGASPDSVGMQVSPSGQVSAPNGLTPQGADIFKKTLDQSVERDGVGRIRPDSESMGNVNIGKNSAAFTGELRNLIPGYSDALDTSGDYLSLNRAYNNASGMLFNKNVSGTDMANMMGSASPAEQNAMQTAMANDIYTKYGANQLRAKDFMVPHVQDKLSEAFGPGVASDLNDAATQEAAMLPAENRIPTGKGSPTMPLTGAAQEQDGGIDVGKVALDALTGAAISHNPFLAGARAVGGAVMRAGNIYGMSLPVRNEAGSILLGSPSDAADYLSSVGSSGTPDPSTLPNQSLGVPYKDASGSVLPIPAAGFTGRLPTGLFGSGADQFLYQNGFWNSPSNPTPN